MALFDEIWGYFTKLPELLNEYGTFSYPLLTVLLAGGVLIVAVHLYRRRSAAGGLPASYLVLGCALTFLSVSGFFLKGMGRIGQERVRQAFIQDHRAPEGEHWLLVFDFTLPPALANGEREGMLNRMELLVATLSEVLIEDLPAGFRQPRVVRVPTAESPWRSGVGQQNFDEVSTALNAFEVMWGNVHPEGRQAKAFLGIPPGLARDLDTIIPLKDFPLDQDPRREHQFGDGYYRLLGLVTLGMALDTYRQAEQAQADARRRLFLGAADQIARARELVSNRRGDPILSRTLYGASVSALLESALAQAGLSP
jgi:hypothetical protein